MNTRLFVIISIIIAGINISAQENKTLKSLNYVGMNIQTLYIIDMESIGIAVETKFNRLFFKSFNYTLSLGYGIAYLENITALEFTNGRAINSMEQYSHYLLSGGIGWNCILNHKNTLNLSIGLAGRYNSGTYFDYAYEMYDEQENKYFIAEFIEGYDSGILMSLSYTYNISSKISLQFESRYINFSKYTDLITGGIGCFYRF